MLVLALVLFLAGGCQTAEKLGTGSEAVTEAMNTLMARGETAAPRRDFEVPAQASLCGEPVPIDRPAVREKLEFEFITAANHQAQVELWRRRAKRYFPLI